MTYQTWCAVSEACQAPTSPAEARIGDSLTHEQRAKLQWVREGYKAALQAVNQGSATSPSTQMLMQFLAEPAAGEKPEALQSCRQASELETAGQPQPASACQQADAKTSESHMQWVVQPANSVLPQQSGSNMPASASRLVHEARARRQVKSTADAQRLWAGFAKQHDALSFAEACNAAVQHSERQVSAKHLVSCW